MNFRIVPMAEEYIDDFHAALDSVAKERRYLLFLEAPPPEEVRKFVLGNLRKGHPHHVALVDQRVAGWCDILPIDRPTRAHCGMLGIAVLAEYRGHGIGSALARAGLLYERFGFVPEGRQRNAVRIDGAYEDLICMALML